MKISQGYIQQPEPEVHILYIKKNKTIHVDDIFRSIYSIFPDCEALIRYHSLDSFTMSGQMLSVDGFLCIKMCLNVKCIISPKYVFTLA